MSDQLGLKAKTVLGCLSKHSPKTRMELELALKTSLVNTMSHMMQRAYTRRNAGSKYEITNQGRIALGEEVTLPQPKSIRFCNASMHDPYIPGAHAHHGRIGLARIT